ncbi:tetratricopeptide (TPR) repeat protein [Nonomuraea thailandensis]|uniref:Tetratricopeptide (TPR) repeat protein n=1 Tax=Nonomuraea thailandensis TaxID=1188745 RepID=A0A9X2GFH7_9ACTN|nr:tetratricopeptide repeat protein [Nonomuraea thailandensis]MCP2357951.1 tetratricopeptide (TPR) repeat protein [Nonomuraea thailandensis]
MAGAPRAQRRGRLVIVALGPMAGVAAGGLTNLLTMTWNWWLFGGLALTTSLLSAGTLIALPRGHPPHPATLQAEDAQAGSVLRPPSGTRVFVGRGKDLRRLTAPAPEGDRPGPLVMVITGMPGTGKTELAICAARALAARYPDGLFWLGLRTYTATESQMTSTEALRTLLNALDVPSDPNATGVTALSRTWQAATTGKKMLIVLDDADTAGQIRPLLPAAEGSAILVTTRHVLVGLDPDHSITLQPLTRGQAAQLARAVLRRAGLNDPQAVAAIADAFRLPLAIRQMSDLKAANPAHDLLAAPVGTAGDETSAAFARSLAALAKPARLVLRRAAHYPGSLITAPIAAVLAGQPVDEAATMLATLYQRGLLIPDNRASGGYRMHDAVRTAALLESDRHDSARHLAAADERLFRYTNSTIDAAVLSIDSSASVTCLSTGGDDGRVPPPRHESDVAALRWLDRHHTDLLAVARRCLSARSPQTWRLVHNLQPYQRMRGFYTEIIELNSQALGLAQNAGDLLGQAAMHQNLGLVDMRTSDHLTALARFRISLELYAQAGNQAGQRMIHHELCNVHKWLGDFARARAHATFCFEAASSGEDLTEQAFAHSSLGTLDRLEGRYTAAREHLTRSMELFEQAGQRRGLGICHRQLGMLEEHLGRHHDARAHLDQALSLFEKLGDLMNQADTHHNLAVVHRGLGSPATAHEHAVTALTLACQISHFQGQADAHAELARLARSAGDHPAAHVHLRHAHDLNRRFRHARESGRPGPPAPLEPR